MTLLELAVRIFAKDETSSTIDGVAGGITGKLGSAAKVAAGAFAAVSAAAAGAVVAVGKQAFDQYAQFEQLQGGIEKLYGDSAGKMMDYAQGAYSTMGLSANDYMSQVSGFSAALISDLGGDTSKAADMANVAMSSIADNVSVFGSNVEDVQNAYQGFAKQNYTIELMSAA